jgi:hypothetical protein
MRGKGYISDDDGLDLGAGAGSKYIVNMRNEAGGGGERGRQAWALGGDAGEEQQQAVVVSGRAATMSGGHTMERKERAGGAGSAMRGRAGEAHLPEARAAWAGQGDAALAARRGWAAHYEVMQTCAGRAVGVRQVSMAAEQEERRVACRRCACRL